MKVVKEKSRDLWHLQLYLSSKSVLLFFLYDPETFCAQFQNTKAHPRHSKLNNYINHVKPRLHYPHIPTPLGLQELSALAFRDYVIVKTCMLPNVTDLRTLSPVNVPMKLNSVPVLPPSCSLFMSKEDDLTSRE